MKKLFFLIILCLTTELVSQTTLPAPNHIVVLILENHSYSQIMDSSVAPYIKSLAEDSCSALFTNFYAIEHPSQPNYLDLFSGNNQGVTSNDLPTIFPFTSENLANQLIESSKSFIIFSEDLPNVGFNGAKFGAYVRKHNPAANWMGTDENQLPETINQPFSAFPFNDFNLLPTVCFVVPNQSNNMHDGTDPERITNSDNWIKNNLDGFIQWVKNNNSLLILTFDEDNYESSNHILTIFTGKMVKGGTYSETHNLYSILRTIEDMYELPNISNAATATQISNCWKEISGVENNHFSEYNFIVYPNPVKDYLSIESYQKNYLNNYKFQLFNIYGNKELEIKIESSNTNVKLSDLSSGIYFYKIFFDFNVIKKGKIIKE